MIILLILTTFTLDDMWILHGENSRWSVSWDLKGCNILLGENVKEFFRRVAAITFEQAILRELESQEARAGKLQIGSGGVLSK